MVTILVARRRRASSEAMTMGAHTDRPATPTGALVTNAMSVDVEEYFHAWALSAAISKADWPHWPSRVEASTDRILELFEAAGVKATFFVLGCVARAHPKLAPAIVEAGHELASHGHAHDKVSVLDRRAFHADVLAARLLLEDQSGVAVRGYRAPSFSIRAREWWAYEVLEAAGYTYSSSLHPIPHDHYGLPRAPRHPFRPTATALIEIPLATLDLGRRVSCAGGGYFRLMPYAWSGWCLRRHTTRERRPAAFYFHPWEIDPGQPRVAGLPLRSRLRHYVNLARMEEKLVRVLREFRWGRIDEAFDLSAEHPTWSPAVPPTGWQLRPWR